MNYQKAINIWDTLACRNLSITGDLAGHIPAIAKLSDLLPGVDYDTIIDLYEEIKNIQNDAIVDIPENKDLLVAPKGQEPFMCVGVTLNNGISIYKSSSDTIKITEVLKETYEPVFKKQSIKEQSSINNSDWYYRYINIGTQRKIYG